MSDELSDDDVEVEETQPQQPTELRAQLTAANKEKKALEKQLRELAAFKEQTERAAQEVALRGKFQEAGLPDSLAKFYLLDENKPDDVTEWAQQNGLIQPAAAAATSQTFTPFTPTAVGTPPEPALMSRADFDQLMMTDPAKAMSIPRERIDWKHKDSATQAFRINR